MEIRKKTYMKNTLFLLLALAVSMGVSAQKKVMKPYFSTVSFMNPQGTPFVENSIAFDNRTVVYKQESPGRYRATVEISTIFKREGKVAAFSKVALSSPVVSDTANIDGAFIDQQRFSIPNGEYEMEIALKDLNNPNGYAPNGKSTIVVDFPAELPCVSDILFFDSYSKSETPSACTKSGLDFVPRVIGFYGANDAKLNFYAEIYNSNFLYEDGKYLVNYYIQSCESSSKMVDYGFAKRFDVAPANVLLTSIDISGLPSGNYYLVVEVRDRSNTLVASNSARFQKSNPGVGYDVYDLNAIVINNTFVSEITNVDSLRMYLRYLDPVCSEAERGYVSSLVKTDDVKTMQQFLYNFWSSRSPMNPREGWEDYLGAVRRVNASYSTPSYQGYRTDRGYVFLKYGLPDKIVESPNEPGAYPYEIWHYYAVANQRNKRFVFMTKDFVTNDYHLIHSDVVGEINNPRWQLEIYSRNYGQGYDQGWDQTEYEQMYGSRASDLYNNPR